MGAKAEAAPTRAAARTERYMVGETGERSELEVFVLWKVVICFRTTNNKAVRVRGRGKMGRTSFFVGDVVF